MAKRLQFDEDIEDGNYIEGSSDDISELEGDLDEQLASITAELGGAENDVEFSMMVYKIIPRTGTMEYLFTVFPHELPILDRLRDEYNGGSFETRVYKKEAGKNKKLFRKLRQNVGTPPAGSVRKESTGSGEISQAIAVMMEGVNKIGEMVMTLNQNQQAAPPPQQPSMIEMMQGMAAMMQAMQSMAPKPVGGGSEVKTLLEGMKLGQELTAEKGETSSGDILLEAIKSFGPALSEATKVAQQQPQQSTQAPPVNPTVKANPQPKKGNDKVNMQELMLKAQLKNLVKCAEQKKDPLLYGDLVIDNVPEEQLKKFLGGDDVKARLVKLNPKVSNNWEWFDEMIQHVNGYLNEEDELTEPEEGGTNSTTIEGDVINATSKGNEK